MFGDNLMLLHWNLRKVVWLEQPEQFSFDRSDACEAEPRRRMEPT